MLSYAVLILVVYDILSRFDEKRYFTYTRTLVPLMSIQANDTPIIVISMQLGQMRKTRDFRCFVAESSARWRTREWSR